MPVRPAAFNRISESVSFSNTKPLTHGRLTLNRNEHEKNHLLPLATVVHGVLTAFVGPRTVSRRRQTGYLKLGFNAKIEAWAVADEEYPEKVVNTSKLYNI